MKKIVSYLMSLTLFIMLLTFHIIGNGEGVFNTHYAVYAIIFLDMILKYFYIVWKQIP